MMSSEEFLKLLDFLYLKVSFLEKDSKFSIVSSEIDRLRKSLKVSDYYRFSIDKTIETVCSLFEKSDDSYEGYRNVFRSKEVAMILDIADANLPILFGCEMGKLYYDDDYVVGIHGSLHQGFMIESSHFSTGLLCIHGPRINRVVKLKDDGLDFYSFLQYKYYEDSDVNAMIIRIPRSEITSPIWRKANEGVYLNPKFIYGYYKSFYSDGQNKYPKIILNPNYGKDDFKKDSYYDISDQFFCKEMVINKSSKLY